MPTPFAFLDDYYLLFVSWNHIQVLHRLTFYLIYFGCLETALKHLPEQVW